MVAKLEEASKAAPARRGKFVWRLLFAALLPLSAIAVLLGVPAPTVGLLLAAVATLLLVSAIGARHYSQLFGAAVLILLGISTWFGAVAPLRFYPVCMSAAAAALFIGSYFGTHSLIERVALQLDPQLPPAGFRYCRKVNHVWSTFLLLNTLTTALLAAYADIKIWALYTGLLSYALAALLMVIEYGVRLRFKKRLVAADAV